MSTHMILDENNNLKPATLLEWAEFFEDTNKRRVKQEHVGEYFVSTMFLGINHGFNGIEQWFETMVFKDGKECYCERYTFYNQAVEGHKSVIDRLRSNTLEMY